MRDANAHRLVTQTAGDMKFGIIGEAAAIVLRNQSAEPQRDPVARIAGRIVIPLLRQSERQGLKRRAFRIRRLIRHRERLQRIGQRRGIAAEIGAVFRFGIVERIAERPQNFSTDQRGAAAVARSDDGRLAHHAQIFRRYAKRRYSEASDFRECSQCCWRFIVAVNRFQGLLRRFTANTEKR